jgi:hypothetical protein
MTRARAESESDLRFGYLHYIKNGISNLESSRVMHFSFLLSYILC